MKTTTIVAIAALLASVATTPLWAGGRSHDHDHRRDRDHDRAPVMESSEQGMQAVFHNAAAAAPGEGWQYFSDPEARRAVVISPQGDYYLSRGKGLRWVAAAQAAL